MADENIVNVQIIFTKETKHGIFRDAIYMPKDKYDNIKSEELEGIKKERADKWVKDIDDASGKVLTEEEVRIYQEQQEENYRCMIANLEKELARIVTEKNNGK